MQAWQSLLEYPISTAGNWRWSWTSQDLSTNLSATRYDCKPRAVPATVPLPFGECKHRERWCVHVNFATDAALHTSISSLKILLFLSRLKINIGRLWSSHFPQFLLQDYKNCASVPKLCNKIECWVKTDLRFLPCTLLEAQNVSRKPFRSNQCSMKPCLP